jgi:hypothetical protein
VLSPDTFLIVYFDRRYAFCNVYDVVHRGSSTSTLASGIRSLYEMMKLKDCHPYLTNMTLGTKFLMTAVTISG